MSFQPFLLATFCDDVRQEVGNKLSYLGIYGPNLIVPKMPTTLAKLCCIFTLRIPATSLPRKVVFKLLREEEVIFEAELLPQDDAILPTADPAEDHALTISNIAQFVAFDVIQPARLKARAIVDGLELSGGSLDLQALQTSAAN